MENNTKSNSPDNTKIIPELPVQDDSHAEDQIFQKEMNRQTETAKTCSCARETENPNTDGQKEQTKPSLLPEESSEGKNLEEKNEENDHSENAASRAEAKNTEEAQEEKHESLADGISFKIPSFASESFDEDPDLEDSESTKAKPLPETPFPAPSSAFENGISVFAISQAGESHKVLGTPCQDRSAFRFINNKIVIAAIADGVGSCSLSDLGAWTAVNASLDYLQSALEKDLQSDDFRFDDTKRMGKLLRAMMAHALHSVQDKAEEYQLLDYSMQSTLTVAVYDGRLLYYAHAGDDGIVVMLYDSHYQMVTNRHKGEQANSVYPLQSQKTWEFYAVDQVAAFVMATDGILDYVVRSELENNRVYFPFLKPVFYSQTNSAEETEALCAFMDRTLSSDQLRRSVHDDLTFLAVINQKAMANVKMVEFDIEEWKRKTVQYKQQTLAALYPDLYGPEAQKKKEKEKVSAAKQADKKESRPEGMPQIPKQKSQEPSIPEFMNSAPQTRSGNAGTSPQNRGSVSSAQIRKATPSAAAPSGTGQPVKERQKSGTSKSSEKTAQGRFESKAAATPGSRLLRGMGVISTVFGKKMIEASEEIAQTFLQDRNNDPDKK